LETVSLFKANVDTETLPSHCLLINFIKSVKQLQH